MSKIRAGSLVSLDKRTASYVYIRDLANSYDPEWSPIEMATYHPQRNLLCYVMQGFDAFRLGRLVLSPPNPSGYGSYFVFRTFRAETLNVEIFPTPEETREFLAAVGGAGRYIQGTSDVPPDTLIYTTGPFWLRIVTEAPAPIVVSDLRMSTTDAAIRALLEVKRALGVL